MISVEADANAPVKDEDEGERLEDKGETYNDVVRAGGLLPTMFNKTEYLRLLKKYLKDVKEKLRLEGEEAKAFMSQTRAEGVRIVDGFNDYEFYVGPSAHPEAAIMLLNYREDNSPYFTVFKAGIEEVAA
ncbi:hypothetical protein BGZ72_008634 [Mortierella alpina]|nr:hypothetical protein BGZ72_008634 [Mortierella alpina]